MLALEITGLLEVMGKALSGLTSGVSRYIRTYILPILEVTVQHIQHHS